MIIKSIIINSPLSICKKYSGKYLNTVYVVANSFLVNTHTCMTQMIQSGTEGGRGNLFLTSPYTDPNHDLVVIMSQKKNRCTQFYFKWQ